MRDSVLKLRALLVDDQSSDRKYLSHLLQSLGDIQIVGEAANASETIELTNNLDYSVIFLNIIMPDLDVFDLAHQLQNRSSSPKIIFTTAHEEYAFAFAINSLDYLPKPIQPERLEEVLKKLSSLKGILAEQTSDTLISIKNELTSPPYKPLEVIPFEQKDKIIILH